MKPLVVLTRPEGDNTRLQAALAAQHYDVHIQPVLKIAPFSESELRDPPELRGDDVCIFISANAARMGLPTLMGGLVEQRIVSLAVGPRTAAVIEAEGLPVVTPKQMDSEGLLALPELEQVKGRRVILVKGEGGREALAQELEAREAQVEEYVCYRRESAAIDIDGLCATFADYPVIIFQANSGQTLTALSQALAQCQGATLLQQRLIVPSQRVADEAQALGWQRIVVAESASDEAFLAALCEEGDMEATTSNAQSEADADQQNPSTDSAEPSRATSDPAPHAAPGDNGSSPAPAVPKQSSPSAPSPSSSGSRSGFAGVLFFVLVVLLGGIGSAGYLWLWPTWQAQSAAVVKMTQQLDALKAADLDLRNRLAEQLTGQAIDFDQRATQQMTTQLADQARERADFEEQQRRMADRLERLDIRLARLTATDRRAWLANEAAFVVRLAAQRLLVARDVNAAEALLNNADALLSEVDDPRFEAARIALARDLSDLRSAPRIDSVGLYARFAALVAQVEAVHVGLAPLAPADDAKIPPQDWVVRAEAGWQAALSKLSRYLVVRRRDAELSRLMTPDGETLVRQNLRLLLEQAQMAALAHHQALYDASLARSAVFIAEFQVFDSARTQAIRAEIDALAALNIAPTLPNLLDSRAAIADALRAIGSSGTTPVGGSTLLLVPTTEGSDGSNPTVDSRGGQ